MSSPSRLATGAPGLDRILHGGLAQDNLYLVQGAPGTGKTTLALQFLLAGEREGEPGLLVSHSETKDELLEIARSHGWELGALGLFEWQSAGELDHEGYTIFHAAEVELGRALSQLVDEVERTRPRRVAIDSILGLRLLAPDEFFYSRQLRVLRSFFLGRDCTVLLLDESGDSRAETLAHGVLRLEQVAQDFGPPRRRLSVTKMRGSTYSPGYHDFAIRRGGLEVYPRLVAGGAQREYEDQPVPAGVEGLDELLGGGVQQGTTTLLVGPSGVGKSTIAAHYAIGAAERGERAQVVLFDEVERTWLARLSSLGADPTSHIEDGRLQLLRLDPAEVTPGWLTEHLRSSVEAGVRLIVLDSLNGLLLAFGDERDISLHLRHLLTWLGSEGVTTFLTLSQSGPVGPNSTMPIDLSYLADNVLLLRYIEHEGELRQAVSALKKRTGAHERTIRQLSFDRDGLRVGEVLREFSGLLSGSPHHHGSGGRLLDEREGASRP